MWAPQSLELVFFEEKWKRQENDSGECGQSWQLSEANRRHFCQLSLDDSNQGLRHSGSIGTGRVAESEIMLREREPNGGFHSELTGENSSN